MADRLNQLKAFVEKEKNTMKSFKDPKNIEKHKWYIKESLSNMKGEMLRDIDSLLQDKRVTLMRQYNNHNDSLRREISELENERKEIYNFKFNDGAIMKDNKAKVKSYLAQEFRDLKARLSKKSFKDAVDTLRVRIKAYQYGKDGEYAWYAEETNGQRATGLSTKYFKTAEEAIAAGKKEVRGYNTNSTKWVIVDEAPKSKREVWLVGLSSIKDSLKRFKDSYDIIRKHIKHNGCDISIIETGMGGSFRFLIEKNGKKKKSVNVFFSQLEAEDEAKHTAESFNDSAINDEIVRRVDYKGCHIYIGKQGSYTYSVYTKNSMGRPLAWETGYNSEAEALEDAKKSADLIAQKYGDSAEYINDRKIDIKRDGKLIDVVNAETLDEAVRIYERQHPELKGQIDAYFSDSRFDPMEELGEQYDMGLQSKHLMVSLLKQKYGMTNSEAKEAVEQFAREVKEMGLSIRDAKINFSKSWAERMFEAGYTARETAMKIDEYITSTDIRAKKDLIAELEHLRNVYFENKRNAKRANR